MLGTGALSQVGCSQWQGGQTAAKRKGSLLDNSAMRPLYHLKPPVKSATTHHAFGNSIVLVCREQRDNSQGGERNRRLKQTGNARKWVIAINKGYVDVSLGISQTSGESVELSARHKIAVPNQPGKALRTRVTSAVIWTHASDFPMCLPSCSSESCLVAGRELWSPNLQLNSIWCSPTLWISTSALCWIHFHLLIHNTRMLVVASPESRAVT